MSDEMTEATAVTDPAPVELGYVSPAVLRQWGPIGFRPSVLSLLMVAVAVAGATLLGLRHHPWRLVGRVPASSVVDRPFTADGLFLTFDARRGANLWDPSTGGLVRNVSPKIDPSMNQYFVVKGGEEILELPRHERVARFYDSRSGRLLRRVPNAMFPEAGRVTVYPDASRFIVSARPFSGPRALVWDLNERQASGVGALVGELAGDYVSLSEDGSRILTTRGRDYWLIDARTLNVIDAQPDRGSASFVSDEIFMVRAPAGTSSPGLPYEIRSTGDGRLLRSADAPSTALAGSWIGQVSGDGRYVTVGWVRPTGRGIGGLALTPAVVEFIDATSNRLAYKRDCMTTHLQFLPHSSRYLTVERIGLRLALYDPGRAQPLAVFPGTGQIKGSPHLKFSPDGKSMLFHDGVENEMAVYRRAGWDCAESHLGAIVFPQTWLTAVASFLAALLLYRDAARRGRGRAAGSSRGIGRLMLAVGLPLAVYALVCACLGLRREAAWFAPGGLLVVGAIGMALGSRFWGVANLCILGGVLSYGFWAWHRVYGAGWRNWSLYPVLDRHYDVPHLAVLIGLGLTILVMGAALLVLARRPGGGGIAV